MKLNQKWGGEAASSDRRAPNWYTPQPGMFMTPSLYRFLELISYCMKDIDDGEKKKKRKLGCCLGRSDFVNFAKIKIL